MPAFQAQPAARRGSPVSVSRRIMTPADFVACAAKEKEELLAAYFVTGSETEVAKKIEAMRLTPDQKKEVMKVVDGVLTGMPSTLSSWL